MENLEKRIAELEVQLQALARIHTNKRIMDEALEAFRTGRELPSGPVSQAKAAKSIKEFKALAQPLIEYLRKKHGPHTEIRVTWDQALFLSEELGIPFPYTDEEPPTDVPMSNAPIE